MTLFVIFLPYHFVRTILSMPFCRIPFCPYTILSIPFCPYHFVRYHFVLEPMWQVISAIGTWADDAWSVVRSPRRCAWRKPRPHQDVQLSLDDSSCGEGV